MPHTYLDDISPEFRAFTRYLNRLALDQDFETFNSSVRSWEQEQGHRFYDSDWVGYRYAALNPQVIVRYAHQIAVYLNEHHARTDQEADLWVGSWLMEFLADARAERMLTA